MYRYNNISLERGRARTKMKQASPVSHKKIKMNFRLHFHLNFSRAELSQKFIDFFLFKLHAFTSKTTQKFYPPSKIPWRLIEGTIFLNTVRFAALDSAQIRSINYTLGLGFLWLKSLIKEGEMARWKFYSYAIERWNEIGRNSFYNSHVNDWQSYGSMIHGFSVNSELITILSRRWLF